MFVRTPIVCVGYAHIVAFVAVRWVEVVRRQRVKLRVRRRLRESLKCRGAQFALGRLEKQQDVDRYIRGADKRMRWPARSARTVMHRYIGYMFTEIYG